MKLLVLSQYFWPEGFRINDVVLSLAARGHDVDVLTAKPNYPGGEVFPGYRATGCTNERWSSANVYRVPIVPRGNARSLRLAANYLSFIISALLFAPWLLRRKEIDAVFVYAPSPLLQAIPAIYLAWLKKCPLIVWVQDLWPESLAATGHVKNRFALRVVGSCVRFIYRHTDLVLVQSRAFAGPVAELAPGKTIKYFPNSVESIFLEPVAARAPEADAKFTVLFAGNVGTAQAIEVIVEAAELLRSHTQIEFVVAGKGSRWDWLQAQIAAKGLSNIHLPGRLPVEAMPALMSGASALLVTLTDEAIFAMTVPAKVQAYMAVGRPIIACLNGEGARLVTEAGAGLATPAGDAKALADAVLQLFNMPAEQRNLLGQNGRRYFMAHFEHEKLVSELIENLKETIVRYEVEK